MFWGTAGKPNTGNVEWRYKRRRPEQTLLYQLVAEHYPRFIGLLAGQGCSLPHYVQREFDEAPQAKARQGRVPRPAPRGDGRLLLLQSRHTCYSWQ